jgi:NAD(P)-dependent dehydrogenase (short-subunit alcohol dehydrogenase family)
MSTWFITGASRGIGRELTEQVLARGDRVAATLRRPEQLDDLKERFGGRLWTRRLDVTDTGEIDRVVREAFADHDRIDVVVSNAGYGVFGVAEDLSDEQVDGMLATNLTGSIQLARRVVPHLREQGGGVLVQLSSMGGHITLPGFAIYHATKWGVEGYLEALAQEIAPFGIHTILVEPGMVRTSFYDAAERVALSDPYRGGPADLPDMPVEEMPRQPVRRGTRHRRGGALTRPAAAPASELRHLRGRHRRASRATCRAGGPARERLRGRRRVHAGRIFRRLTPPPRQSWA